MGEAPRCGRAILRRYRNIKQAEGRDVMNIGKKRVYGIFLLFVCAVILVLFYLFPGQNLRIPSDSFKELDDWSFRSAEINLEHVNLPARFEMEKGQPFVIEKRLDEAFSAATYLCFRSSLQKVRLLLDEKELYRQDFENDYPVKLPVASMWNIIPLPEDSQGKLLSIEFISPYKPFSGYLNQVIYGSKAAVLSDILNKYLPGLLLTFLILFIGIAIMCLGLLLKSNDYSLIYIGLFAVLISIWLFAESKVMQFFTGSQFIIGGLAYLAIPLCPVPLMFYMAQSVTVRFRRVYLAFAALFGLELAFVTFLQLSGICDLFDSVYVSNLSVIAVMFIAITLTIFEAVKDRNREAQRFLVSASVLCVFALSEFLSFYFNLFNDTSNYIRVGFLIFICLVGIMTYQRVQTILIQSREAQFYERLAYIDILTEIKNRYAFENAFERYQDPDDDIRSLRLVIFDLNDLKIINDTYGHKEGDMILKESAKCITEAFQPLGECYRIGGDEFACMIENHTEEEYLAALHNLRALIDERNKAMQNSSISISVGSSVCDSMQICNFKVLFEQADANMYEDKIRQKKRDTSL